MDCTLLNKGIFGKPISSVFPPSFNPLLQRSSQLTTFPPNVIDLVFSWIEYHK